MKTLPTITYRSDTYFIRYRVSTFEVITAHTLFFIFLQSRIIPFWSIQSSKTTLFSTFYFVDTMLKLPFWKRAMTLC